MTYNVDELFARMQAGESMDSIAMEITDALNAAAVKHENAVRAAQEAERVKLAAETKRQEMAEILMHIADFLQKHYPDLCREAVGKMSPDDKNELFNLILDATLEALEETANPKRKKMFDFGMDPMTMMLMQSMMHNNKTPAPEKQPKAKSDDEILNDFLGKICH